VTAKVTNEIVRAAAPPRRGTTRSPGARVVEPEVVAPQRDRRDLEGDEEDRRRAEDDPRAALITSSGVDDVEAPAGA
jgi:hypothetical protein